METTWKEFIDKYFNKNSDELYYISKEEIKSGVANSDLSHYTQEEVEKEFENFLNKEK